MMKMSALPKRVPCSDNSVYIGQVWYKVRHKGLNATNIQQPIKFFPVSSKQLLHSLAFRFASNLPSTKAERAPSGEFHVP